MADNPAQPQFDVFLSHNSLDKPAVIALAKRLQANGVKVWLDAWELRPGHPWQEALAEIIETTLAAVVLVGKDGLGPWENAEMSACLDEFVRRKLPVIPVLLPDCPSEPDLPLLLRRFTWVDFRKGSEEEGFSRLIWGITGKKPSMIQSAGSDQEGGNWLGGASQPTKPAKADGKPVPSKLSAAIFLGSRNFISVVLGWRRFITKSKILLLALLALLALIGWKMKDTGPFWIEMLIKTTPDAKHGEGASKDGMPASSPAVTNDAKPAILEPEMVSLPGGEFWMGSDKKDDPMAFDYELPRHKVMVKPFYIGKYEVTVGEYAAFVKATNRQSQGCYVHSVSGLSKDASKSWSDPGFQQTDRNPVVCVSHEDAEAYVSWLKEKTRKPYRLPTEAEWEYAARAGSTTRFPFGDDESQLPEYAWCSANSANGTHPVGKLKPNAWGLHDMLGNVWEWVEDAWHKSYAGAPTDGSAWAATEAGAGRVLRGGSWSSFAWYCRSASRNDLPPVYQYFNTGFRCARVQE
ncbi:MAG: SUMF1/EgtB/PvdO family nonheme iron enzyme [Candidatus Methylumidiphilus sp.]